jgi:SAM-dependent methyltransferase
MDVQAEFAKHGPWVCQFRIANSNYGGTISLGQDHRIGQFFSAFPRAETILELGPMEGAQTVELLRRPHVRRIVGVEARASNIDKAKFVQGLLGITNVELIQANLEEFELRTLGKFDAVFCCGLLYHLSAPWKLIEQLANVSSNLFLWTHYSEDASADQIINGFRGHFQPEGGADEPRSGLGPTSFWMTLGSLMRVLTRSGYKTIEVLENDLDHLYGPSISLAAKTE